MSGANVTCANCRRVFWHEDDAAQAHAFLNHKCSQTRRSQTLTNYSRVSDAEWLQIAARCKIDEPFVPDRIIHLTTRDRLAERAEREGWHTGRRAAEQARLNHPSSYSPDGAA